MYRWYTGSFRGLQERGGGNIGQKTDESILRSKITGLLSLIHSPALLKRIYGVVEYLYLHNDKGGSVDEN